MKAIDHDTKLAAEGSHDPLTDSPVVGDVSYMLPAQTVHAQEEVMPGEVRVTILGSGDPFAKIGQASASILVEVGNQQKDMFFFDVGPGSLANFNSLRLPVTSTTKVFLTHLHADHVGDMPGLVWSLAKSGRRDPVEVWGPAGDDEKFGTVAFAAHLEEAFAWDTESMNGHPGQSGAQIRATDVPYDTAKIIYQRDGVTISAFPVIHLHPGAVGYKLEYAGRRIVMSGDTRPCTTLIEAAQHADVLIHEMFPSASVYAKKAGVSSDFAKQIVDSVHTSPAMAGEIFTRVGARMSVAWHFAVDHDTVGPAFREIAERYAGPVTIAQDLTTFNVTEHSVIVRQAIPDPFAWPVVGKSIITGPPMNAPDELPELWSKILFHP